MTDGHRHEAQGREAHAAGDDTAAVSSYEMAYSAHREAGELVAAARAARTAGWLHGWVFGDRAVHRGWLSRARRVLDQADDARARGWLVLDEALKGNNLELQRARYLEAIAIAHTTADRDLECDATASLGMMLVFSGSIEEGMAHLDDALAGICGGEVTELPVVEGCLCGLLNASEQTRDVERATEWLRAAERVARTGNLVAVAASCRSHHAGILVAAGRWSEAEGELETALDMLPDGSSLRSSALCRLADLRVRQGRFEEADHLLDGREHWSARGPCARTVVAADDRRARRPG
jgi:tetratricopeptide (TPR) repeat protein